jgi:hypothetical protein
MEIAKAIVVPRIFWAEKYEVSPITCPNKKLKIRITHRSHGRENISDNIPKKVETRKNVIVPITVRIKLINVGLASFSVFLNNTFDPTNVRTANNAIISPIINNSLINES